MTRYDIIQKFINDRNYKTFLEIGTFKGDTFNHIKIDHKESIDPDTECNATWKMTSDEYFKNSKDKKQYWNCQKKSVTVFAYKKDSGQ